MEIPLIIIVVCHFPPGVMIMISQAITTVPFIRKAAGGTILATIPI